MLKVGVFSALFFPTFQGHRPRTALCGFPVPKVGVFSALFSPTFRGHRPRTALCGFPVPKVGVFSALFSPTFRGHRPRTALCGFPVPKVGVFSSLFSPTFRGHRPRTALCGFPVPKVGVFSALFSPTLGEAAGAEPAAGEVSGKRRREQDWHGKGGSRLKSVAAGAEGRCGSGWQEAKGTGATGTGRERSRSRHGAAGTAHLGGDAGYCGQERERGTLGEGSRSMHGARMEREQSRSRNGAVGTGQPGTVEGAAQMCTPSTYSGMISGTLRLALLKLDPEAKPDSSATTASLASGWASMYWRACSSRNMLMRL